MGSSSFLRVEGIPGTSSHPGHSDWIELFSFSWGVTQGPGKLDVADFAVVKRVDSASPLLALACVDGTRFGTITCKAIARDRDESTIAYTMSDCIITGLRPGGSDEPLEEVTFAFTEMEWRYRDLDRQEDVARSFSMLQLPVRPTPLLDVHSSEVSLNLPAHRSAALRTVEFIPNSAFILMSMDPEDPELEDVHVAIKDVCRTMNVDAVRADDIQHDDRITDLILDRIRTSEFIIADLTGERPNVYYEVGHAHAIGKRPILFRRKGSRLHFDLAVHNVREYRNITELRQLLSMRLRALVQQ